MNNEKPESINQPCKNCKHFKAMTKQELMWKFNMIPSDHKKCGYCKIWSKLEKRAYFVHRDDFCSCIHVES